MTCLNGRWLWLSVVGILGCGGGSQAAAPAASTANEVKETHSAAGPVNPVRKQGSGTVSAKIGPGGGSLELSEGPRVVIPAGAIESGGGQEFVLKVAPKTTAFLNKESERPLGPTFSFSPPLAADGIEFSFPLASLPSGWGEPSIGYEVEAGGEVVGGEDSTRTKWQYERATMKDGRVVAKLSEATGLRLQFVLTNLEAQ
jgi:hypothetical protein